MGHTVLGLTLILASCAPLAPAPAPAREEVDVGSFAQCSAPAPRPLPPVKITPAPDGGLTCFTPKDLAALREYLAKCSGAR